MLINTFIHIPGIGPATEKKLWESDVLCWSDDLNTSSVDLSSSKIETIKTFAEKSNQCLAQKTPEFFEELLPSNQHFRLFPEFREDCAYLDIETTGLDASAMITTIAIYDGKDIKYFIQGENLDTFIDEIQKYKVLITYNGRSFDIPFIEEYFNTKLSHAQIDLRYILQSLGFKGGLKKCEKALGIDREELDGVDGYFAVILWREYMRTGDQKALETLLAYNIEDVINLETLMIMSYNLALEKTPFSESHKINLLPKAKNPFAADMKTINALKNRFY
jgi:uncharacterized protein YprB with RNaseH-like and TPR domain